MIGFAIAAGVFLILAILLLIFRLHTLVAVMKQSGPEGRRWVEQDECRPFYGIFGAQLYPAFLVLGQEL
jgi:hypothetical protein